MFACVDRLFNFTTLNRVLSRFDLASINLFIRSRYALHFHIRNYVLTYFCVVDVVVRHGQRLIRTTFRDASRCLCTVFFIFLISKLILNGEKIVSQCFSVVVSSRVNRMCVELRKRTAIERKRAIIDGCYSAHMGGERTSLYLFCIVHWHPVPTAIRFLLNRTHKNEIKFAGLVSHENKDTHSILNERDNTRWMVDRKPSQISESMCVLLFDSFNLFLPDARESAHLLSVRLAYHTIHPK